MMKRISPTSEDYVKAIFTIHQQGKVVRVKDIAALLGVTRPTVVAAMKTLAAGGMVAHEPYGYIELTGKGHELAEKIQERHNILFHFLHTMLGVEAERADEEACGLEHYISDESIQRLTLLEDFILQLPAHRHVEMEKKLGGSNINKARKGTK